MHYIQVGKSQSPSRLPSLDGLRGISVILVMLGHLGGTAGFARLDLGVGNYSYLGVIVFFVISGFLITTLLRAEEARNGQVNLWRFYARRSIRLFPAAFAYIICLALLSACGWIALGQREFLHALTYTVNHMPERPWLIGHLWSLSVEEQFYLVWPLAFVICRGTASAWVAALVLLTGPLARAFNFAVLIDTPYRDLKFFPMVADSLAAGCMLAILGPSLEQQAWYRRLFSPAWSMALLAFVLVLNRYAGYTAVSVLGVSLINVSIAILVHRSVCLERDAAGRLLNSRPLAWLGTMSYSLYLWQQPFLNRHSTHWVCAFPQNILLALAAAILSWRLIERPLLGWRQRLQASRPVTAKPRVQGAAVFSRGPTAA